MDGIYSVLNLPIGHLKIVASLENLFKKEDFNPKSNAQIIVFSLKLDMHLVAISKEPLYKGSRIGRDLEVGVQK